MWLELRPAFGELEALVSALAVVLFRAQGGQGDLTDYRESGDQTLIIKLPRGH